MLDLNMEIVREFLNRAKDARRVASCKPAEEVELMLSPVGRRGEWRFTVRVFEGHGESRMFGYVPSEAESVEFIEWMAEGMILHAICKS